MGVTQKHFRASDSYSHDSVNEEEGKYYTRVGVIHSVFMMKQISRKNITSILAREETQWARLIMT